MAVCDFFGDGSALALYQFENTAENECDFFDGTWENGPPKYSAGIDGQAADFSENTFININRVFPNGNAFTVSLWCKRINIDNPYNVFGSFFNDEGFYLSTFTNNYVGFFVGTGTGERSIFAEDTTPLDEFSHYIIAHNGLNFKLYVNGVFIDSKAQGWQYDDNYDRLSIGNMTGASPNNGFQGLIDHVRIFDRAVTDVEALELFNELNIAPPIAITDFDASDTEIDQIFCTWVDNGDVDTFDIYRDGSLLTADVTSPYVDSDVTVNTTYTYYVKATNAGGTVDSNTDTGIALSAGTPPSAIDDFVASDNQTEKVTVTFTDATGDPVPTHDLVNDDTDTVIASNVDSGYVWNSGMGTWNLRIDAKNSLGTTASNVDSATALEEIVSVPMFGSVAMETAMYGTKSVECLYYGSKQVWCASKVPMPITDFNASDDLESGVVCTWTNNGDVDTFNLYRDGTNIATDIDSGYEDMTGTAGTTYSYNVEACNIDGCIDSNTDDGLMVAPAYTYCGVVFNGEFDTDLYGWADVNTNMNPVHGEDENGGYVEITPGNQSDETYLNNSEDNLGNFNPKANTEYTLTTISDNSTLYGFGVMYLTTSKAIIFDNIADGGTETVTYTFPADTDESMNANVYIFADANSSGNTFKIHKVCFVEGDVTSPYPPTEITDFNASDTRDDGVRCTWSNATGNPMPTYNLFRDGSSIATDVSSGYMDSVGIGTYTYYVQAINSEGSRNSNEDEGTVIDNTPELPSYISDFNASDDIEDYVECTWSDATNADSYDLYRNTSRIAIDVISGYQDSNAPVGNTYTYYVRAINSDGYTNSNEDDGIRPEDTTELPATITYFEAREDDTRYVPIYWHGYQGYPEADCEIYRDDVLIHTLKYSRKYYEDDTAVPNVVYTYYMKAINSYGEVISETDTGMRLPEVVPPPTELPCDDSIDCDSLVEC